MLRGSAIEAACEKVRHLFIYVYDANERLPAHIYPAGQKKEVKTRSTHLLIFAWTPRTIAYPRASFEPSIIRNGRQIPDDHSPSAKHRRLSSPLVAYILPNPFKKHLFTFRIFRTVLPTATNECRGSGKRASARATLNLTCDEDSDTFVQENFPISVYTLYRSLSLQSCRLINRM